MFIQKNCELNQEFYLAHPQVKCRINNIYNSSFPGSVLWDFNSENFKKLVNSWSTATKEMWRLPYATHRYLIESLSGEHAFTMILSRYIGFLQLIKKSSKKAVQLLLCIVENNLETVTGRNLRYIKDLSGIDNDLCFKPCELKRRLLFCPINSEDMWKISFIKEIASMKHENLCLESSNGISFDQDEIFEILDYLCTS